MPTATEILLGKPATVTQPSPQEEIIPVQRKRGLSASDILLGTREAPVLPQPAVPAQPVQLQPAPTITPRAEQIPGDGFASRAMEIARSTLEEIRRPRIGDGLPAEHVRYQSPDEVFSDIDEGTLGLDTGRQILRSKFGGELPPELGAMLQSRQEFVQGWQKLLRGKGWKRLLGIPQMAFAPSFGVGGELGYQVEELTGIPAAGAIANIAAQIGMPAGPVTQAVGRGMRTAPTIPPAPPRIPEAPPLAPRAPAPTAPLQPTPSPRVARTEAQEFEKLRVLGYREDEAREIARERVKAQPISPVETRAPPPRAALTEEQEFEKLRALGYREDEAREIARETIRGAPTPRVTPTPKIEFESPPPGYRNLEIDPRLLDEDLALDPSLQVLPGGRGAAIPGRYEEVQRFIRTGKQVEPPKVGVTTEGRLTVTDGRHRLAAMREMGAPKVTVAVPEESVTAFSRRASELSPSIKSRGLPEPEASRVGEAGAARTTPGPLDILDPRAEIPSEIPGIRLDKLRTTDDVKGALANIEEFYPEINIARGAPVTWKETNEEARMLAHSLGWDVSQMRKWYPFPGEATAKLRAGKMLAMNSAKDLTDLSQKAARGDKDAIKQFPSALLRHKTIQEEFAKGRAEAGRTLGILRQMVEKDPFSGFAHLLGKELSTEEDVIKAAGHLGEIAEQGNLAAVSRAASKLTEPGGWDKFLEYWYNSILSGPQTHVVNTVGNAITQTLGLTERGIASLFVRGAKGRVRAQAAGMLKSIPEAFRAAREAYKTEISPFATKLELRPRQAIPGKLGRIIRMPGRALMAEDAAFQTIARRGAMNRLAYEQGWEQGLRGENLTKYVDDVTRLKPDELMEKASKEAGYFTFTREPGRLGQFFQNLANLRYPGTDVRPLRLILPFIRTPSNILAFSMERTPLGYVAFKSVREAIRQGGETKALALTRMGLGTGIMGVSWAMWNNETLTGAPPADPRERSVWYAAGRQPYSLRIGDTWVSYNRMEPFGQIMSWVADASQAISQERPETVQDAGLAALGGFVEALTDKTYLSGMGDFFDLVSDPGRYMARWGQRLAGGLIPFSSAMRQFERAGDPTLRDGLFAGIPGLSGFAESRLDVFGNPIELPGPISGLISPARMAEAVEDPTATAMLERTVLPSRPSKALTHRGIEAKLTPEQHREYQQVRGRLLKQWIDLVVDREDWEELPEERQKKLLEMAKSRANEESTKIIKRRFGPQLWGAR